jgi:hypothetical protein
MGKKVKSAAAPVPAKAEKPAAPEPEEISETIQRKKENAKKLEKQMKHTRAQVLASLDLKQTQKAVQALCDFKQK